MEQPPLSENRMYKALLQRDSSFEGIFFSGIKTTGIFCRPSCRARKPRRENVEFFSSTKDALLRGYRPCKVCRPMAAMGETPEWVKPILLKIDQGEALRISDSHIREMRIDPNRLRRWFKQNHKMTFQAYLRSIRLARAFSHLVDGKKVVETAFDHGYESLSGFSQAFKKMLGVCPTSSTQKDLFSVYQILTPLGPMLAGATRKGLCLLEFTDRRMLESELKELQKRFQIPIVVFLNPHIKKLKSQLDDYFGGKRRYFTIPLVTPGSAFQNRVWNVLKEIPYGKTSSYKEQAVALGSEKAVRAVAKANGENKIAILIPCHRVIGSNGKLVGYGGGIWRKKYLLELEKKIESARVRKAT